MIFKHMCNFDVNKEREEQLCSLLLFLNHLSSRGWRGGRFCVMAIDKLLQGIDDT